MIHVVSSVVYVWLIINIVPILIYGLASRLMAIETPKQVSVQQFMLSVFIEKLGVATTFALLFLLGERITVPNWLYFGLLWWYMGALGEIAAALRGSYGWKEALIGMFSELLYFPLAAFTLAWALQP